MVWIRGRWLAVGLLLAAALSTSTAGAAGEREQSRKLGEAGLEAFAGARWQEAYEKFEQADRLFHAPTLVLYMARCQSRLGKPLEAAALYERLLAEPVPADASKAFIGAHEAAKTELAEVLTQVATLRVAVTKPEGSSAQVLIDGAPVAADQTGSMRLAPGEHSVEVRADGVDPILKKVTLEAGRSLTVDVAVPAPGAPRPPPPAAAEPSQGSLLPAIAAFAVGAAGVGVGAVTGIMTLSRADELKAQCADTRCPARLEAEGDRIDALAVMSTVGFIIGGVATAAGVVLVVTRPGGDDGGGAVSATVGPARLDLRGRF